MSGAKKSLPRSPGQMDKPKPPQGVFHGERFGMWEATGEFRVPRKGEHYLSGAVVAAYRAPCDFAEGNLYWIARQVGTTVCTYCKGIGRVKVGGGPIEKA
jgi:hypothetical protein